MFSFRPDLFLNSIPILIQGWLGVFIVTTAIIIAVMLINLFGTIFGSKKK